MFKKLKVLGACLALAAASAVYSAPAQATSYYIVSVCGVPNVRECPSGPNPIWIGPYSTADECYAAWDLWAMGWFNTWPRAITDCIPQ